MRLLALLLRAAWMLTSELFLTSFLSTQRELAYRYRLLAILTFMVISTNDVLVF